MVGDNVGFVSLACCADSNFTDTSTGIVWTPDSHWFPNSSSCINISNNAKSRIFGIALGKRSCYRISTVKGQEYVIRGTFLVKESSASGDSYFGVYIGATLLDLVSSSQDWVVEGSFKAERKYVDFCLEKEKGEPYISYFELRQLHDFRYLSRFPSRALKLITRLNLGEPRFNIRYLLPTFQKLNKGSFINLPFCF